MDKVRFGVIGTNFITDRVIAGARKDRRFVLAAVCSRNQETAEAFARRHGIPRMFTSPEEMAVSPYIDAVYIATPNFTHAGLAVLFMSRGKHVLCEKPLASNAREARQMAEASGRYGVTLMEAMKTTVEPNFLAVRQALGRVGTVRRYFASYCQYSSRYDKLKEGVVLNAFNPAYSNGAVMDIGVYTIYPMIVLFGPPESVTATGTLLPSGVDGQGMAVFRYAGGMEACVLYSKIADSYLPAEIQGESGTIVMDRINRMRQVSFMPRVRNVAGGWGTQPAAVELSVPQENDEYYYEVAEFINTVLSGRRESAVNSHRNSLATMEVVDEIRRQVGVVFPSDSLL